MVKDEIKIIFQDPETINIKTNEENDKFNIDLKDKISFDLPVEHNDLLNLDYENSGHVGFASEKSLNEIKENLQKQISDNLETLNQVNENLSNLKVDKVEGKQLSTNDLTNELLEKLNSLNNYDDTNIQKQIDDIKLILTTDDVDFDTLQELVNALKNNVSSIADIFQLLNRKVEKIEGKGLSTNDFTNEEKQKLAGLNNYDDTSVRNIIAHNYSELNNKINNTYTKQETKDLINSAKPNINYSVLVGQETSNKWSGTTIPNDSYVEKVYFNTELTLNETLSILNNLNFVDYHDLKIWACITDTTLTDYVIIIKIEDGYIIQAFSNGGTPVISTGTLFQWSKSEGVSNGFNENGWATGFSGVANFNMENSLSLVAPSLSFTPENEKASSLFSTTPFEANNSVTTTLYQLNNDGSLNKDKPINIGDNNEQIDYNELINKPIIPTKVSELNNDSGYITKTIEDLTNYYKKSETYTQEEINQKISAIPKFKIEVVNTLPISNISSDTIYLKTISGESPNLYEEYIYVNNQWEKLGTQTVDLTNYALKSELFSKDYNELINKPTIPTNNNQLTNGAGYITNSALTDYAKKSELPIKVSELTNDSGYLTSIPTEYVTETELNELLETKEDKVNLKALAYKDSLNKEDVGLGNVLNVASYSKNEIDTELGQIRKSIDELSGITGDTEIELQNYYTKTQTNELLSLKSNISDLGALAYKNGLTKSDVGLNNVDNTSDLNKPISTATQNALDDKEDKSNLKSLAYKDNLSKEEIGLGNVNNVAITQEQVTQIGTNKTNIENITTRTNTNETKILNVQSTANEALSIAKGRSKTTVFNTLSDMATYLKNANNSEFNLGDNLLIKATNVPDYWISNVLENNIGDYGYYEISILETTKVDLSNYYNKGEVDIKETNINNKINEKANLSDVYTKTQINSAFASRDESITSLEQNKANKSDIPTKVSQLTNDSGYLTQHQSLTDYAKKSELPTKTSQLTNDSGYLTTHQDISGKADKVDVYTKTEIDNSFSTRDTNITNISNKANTNATNIENLSKNKEDKVNLKALAYKDSLTKSDVGLDKVNNVSITSNQVEQIGTNATEISSLKTLVNTNETDIEKKVSDINTQIDNIKKVLSSDDTDYDTLQELVNALKNNVSSISDLFTQIAKKVDKVSGKGLSTNDYTTTEKNKLANIEEGANNYVLPSDVVKDSKYVHTDNNYTTTDKNKLAGLSNYDDTSIKNTLSTKADKTELFSGSYKDLTNKPTIPTVNNATLTIQKNGTTVATFSANSSTNATANISVPTKVSQLENDSGFTQNTGTVTSVKVGNTSYSPTSGVVSLPVYPSVPTKVSQLQNDSGYLTTETNTTYSLSKTGSTIKLTGSDGSESTVTDSDTNTTYNDATTSVSGLMSATDKKKLDGIDSGANAYTLPTANASTLGGVKIGSNITNSNGIISLTKDDVTTALGYTPPEKDTNTTYTAGTGITLSGTKFSNKAPLYFITPSVKSEGSSTSGSYLAEKWSVANVDGITALTNGMTIALRIPSAGVSGGILLSIDNGTTYKPIVRNVNSLVTTHYSAGATIILTYNSSQTASPYLTSGTASEVTGCWQIADYDSNTKNSTGTSNKTSSKMYLVGGTSQNSSGVTTYSNVNCYIGTDNCLYSNAKITATQEWVEGKGYLTTWRGIQNNLTSTSTTESLSANQGKVLNGKITTIQGYFDDQNRANNSVNSTFASYLGSSTTSVNVGGKNTPVYFVEGYPYECNPYPKYYQHNIYIAASSPTAVAMLSFINTTSTAYTSLSTLQSAMKIALASSKIMATGVYNKAYQIIGAYCSGDTLYIQYVNAGSIYQASLTTASITDKVITC